MIKVRRPNETREMRLISKVIELTPDVPETSLDQFIARRRQPGDQWASWDQVTIDLYRVIDQIVTDVTLRRWAEKYGIPEGTLPEGGPVTADEYAAAMQKARIDL
jgi:hypothetical protein